MNADPTPEDRGVLKVEDLAENARL